MLQAWPPGLLCLGSLLGILIPLTAPLAPLRWVQEVFVKVFEVVELMVPQPPPPGWQSS